MKVGLSRRVARTQEVMRAVESGARRRDGSRVGGRGASESVACAAEVSQAWRFAETQVESHLHHRQAEGVCPVRSRTGHARGRWTWRESSKRPRGLPHKTNSRGALVAAGVRCADSFAIPGWPTATRGHGSETSAAGMSACALRSSHEVASAPLHELRAFVGGLLARFLPARGLSAHAQNRVT